MVIQHVKVSSQSLMNGLHFPFLTANNKSIPQGVGLNATSSHTLLWCVGSNCNGAKILFADAFSCFNVFTSYSCAKSHLH